MVAFLRAMSVTIGFTPPPPEKEKSVAAIVFALFVGIMAGMTALGFFLVYMMTAPK